MNHLTTQRLAALTDQDGDDNLPGTPWTPPEPSPDGDSPEGDGKHRK